MKNFRWFIFIIIFISCGQNKKTEKNPEEKGEHESIHQQDLEKYGKSNSQFNFEIVENKTLIDTTIGNFTDPRFSIDGKKLFFTSANYSEIWVYNLNEETLNKLVSLPQCGVNFQISDNGEKVYFRNKVTDRKKSYSILSYSLNKKTMEVLYTSKKRISPPLLNGNNLYFLEDDKPKSISTTDHLKSGKFTSPFIYVLDNKLFKRDSSKITSLSLPPNVIPVSCGYSKDRQNVFVLTTNMGIVICDKNGIPINNIKDANVVSKLYKSSLLVFTKETDSNNKIVSSKMFIGFLNSDKNSEILQKNKSQKFSPDWSPTENKIIFTTANGAIKMISFNIGKS